ncbi:MAG: hypothetical protein ACLQF2_09225 [Rhodomicrobium sp.]
MDQSDQNKKRSMMLFALHADSTLALAHLPSAMAALFVIPERRFSPE